MRDIIESFKIVGRKNLANYLIVHNERDLEKLDFPYFIKISSGEHKTEARGVLKCRNLQEAKKNFQILKNNFRKEIMIQEAIEGIEMIIGLKEDRVFGKLLMIGFGGTFVEVTKDVSFRALPLEKNEIREMVEELKFYPILFKRKKYAIDKFIKLAFEVSKLKISEMDLNPVIINEKGAFIVDARIN